MRYVTGKETGRTAARLACALMGKTPGRRACPAAAANSSPPAGKALWPPLYGVDSEGTMAVVCHRPSGPDGHPVYVVSDSTVVAVGPTSGFGQ